MLCGQRLAGGKASQRNARNRRFRAAGNHHVGIAHDDEPRRVANGVGARGTGGDDGMIGAAQLVADRDLAGGKVDQTARNEEGRYPARAAVAQRDAAFDNAFETTDARADHHAGGDLVFVGLRMPAGVVERHVGCGHCIDDETVDLALFLQFHPVVGIEGAIGTIAERQAAGDLCRKVIDFEFGHPAGGIAAGDEPRPGHFGPAAQGRYHAGTGDNDTSHARDPSCLFVPEPDRTLTQKTGSVHPFPVMLYLRDLRYGSSSSFPRSCFWLPNGSPSRWRGRKAGRKAPRRTRPVIRPVPFR